MGRGPVRTRAWLTFTCLIHCLIHLFDSLFTQKELDFEGINGCVLQQKAPPSSPEASEKVSTAEEDRDSSSAEEVEEEEMEDKEEEKEEGTNVTPEKEKQTDLLTVEQAGAPVEETMEDDLEEGEVTIDNPYEETK